jgi:tetratricopeptide (TPR) repeat protein
LFLGGCSTKKNTGFRRGYHAFTTTYNVHFNGGEAFKRGYKNIEDSYKPDYANIINMYAVSDKSTAGAATGDMARAVEKCEKAIKEHSIRVKPKKNLKKTSNTKYMVFYNKEEFNSKMYEVWMLMAKAKFYSNDYLAASATFTYVINHFSENKVLVAEASIWKARCFKEMGWTYEATDLLKRVSDDKFTNKQNRLYAGAYADLLIREGHLKEALPYLETAISLEKSKKMRTRFMFIAGQIYQKLGDKEKAYAMYDKVISSHPEYQMSLSARIRQTEVYTGNSKKDVIKSLNKMAKKAKNKDYLDQIYYAMGNIYLARKDTARAIEHYILSTEKSTRDGLEKAQSYIALGDLYYEQTKYMKAQPAYSEASAIIGIEHPDYVRVSNLSLILDELAANYQTVVLQDSLQNLATLPKEKRLAIINSVIQQIIKEEIEEQQRRAREYEENKRLDMEIENMAIMDQRALGNAQRITFYFDNKSTVEKGKVEFQRKFGRRKLEDHWNRRNKSIVSFSEDGLADLEDELEGMDADQADSIRESRKQAEAENNPKSVEFYLRQIPFTPEQVAISNEQIADALFEMGIIYNEKLSDYQKSIETFEEFIRRFPKDPRAAEAYFYCYRILAKQEKEAEANAYRNKLIAAYPESTYAKLLSQPDFRQKLERMHLEQDSLYELTYKEFLAGNFPTVRRNTAYMEDNYPVSPLIPKFLLLNSLCIGKTGNIGAFSIALNDLIDRYPNSDVVSMAKDILALMNQGKTPEAGSPGGLMALRDQSNSEEFKEEDVKNLQFKVNNNTPHLFILFTDPQQVNANRVLYEIATYNFTRFLVKDFDIKVRSGQVLVSGLDNLEEALWYINGILENKSIRSLLSGTEYKYLIISEENYDLLLKGLTVEAYETFYRDDIATQKKKKGPKVELIGDEKTLADITATQKVDVKEGDDLNKAKQTVKPQSETPKNETPKNETPKSEAPKSETPKSEEKEKAAPKKEEPVTQEKQQEEKKEEKKEAKQEEKKETKQEEKKEEKKDVKQEEKKDIKQEEKKEEVKKEEKKQEEKKEDKQVEKKEDNPQEEVTKEEVKKEEKPAPETVKTEPVASAPQPAKELQKYKGLYTYDEGAPHYFVVVLPNGGANFGKVRDAIEKYNTTSQSLLNLRVTPESGRALPQMFVVGAIPDAQVAYSYLLQAVKDEGIKESLQGVDYRNIVISKDNLNTLKQSGNLTVYMEFLKQFYLK